MPQKMTDIYIYLARRDKTGVRVLAKFQGPSQIATRVGDIKAFNLPQEWTANITQIIAVSKMLWEPWIQSADSYNDLVDNLKMRGFSNVPTSPRLEFSPSNFQAPVVNASNLPNKQIMLRKD